MSLDFKNFLNKLSDDQLENLKELFQNSQEETNDKRTKRSEKKKETSQEISETEKETYKGTEDHKEKEEGEEFNEEEKIVVNDDFTVIRNTNKTYRKIPVKFKKNEWSDEGEYRDIETPNFEKTPRNRPKPKKEKVECHVCGRTFSINSNLVYGEFHRCNKCTGH